MATIPFDQGEGLLRELAVGAYSSGFAAFIELAANGLDQYVAKDELYKQEKPYARIVKFYIDMIHGWIRCVDGATGIIDKIEFQKIGNRDLEGYSGKNLGSQTSSYKNINPDIIGHKRIGRLSFPYLSKKEHDAEVTYRSNNGKVGMILVMNGLHGWLEPEYMDKADVLPQMGLEVEINDVKPEFLKIPKIIKELTDRFMIRAARHQKIYVVDVNNNIEHVIQKPNDFDCSHEEKLVLLNSDRYITGQLIEKDKPKTNNLMIFVKHVYIKTISIRYKVEGWINADELELVIGRNDIRQTESYDEFKEKLLDKYIPEHFKSLESSDDDIINKSKKKWITDLYDKLEKLAEARKDLRKLKFMMEDEPSPLTSTIDPNGDDTPPKGEGGKSINHHCQDGYIWSYAQQKCIKMKHHKPKKTGYRTSSSDKEGKLKIDFQPENGGENRPLVYIDELESALFANMDYPRAFEKLKNATGELRESMICWAIAAAYPEEPFGILYSQLLNI